MSASNIILVVMIALGIYVAWGILSGTFQAELRKSRSLCLLLLASFGMVTLSTIDRVISGGGLGAMVILAVMLFLIAFVATIFVGHMRSGDRKGKISSP